MIVIPTHNGENTLKYLLKDIENCGINNDKVCIVDNQSDVKTHLDYLEQLKTEEYNVLYNPKSTYCIGALRYALDYVSDDVWFLFHDNIRLKQNIFEMVIPKLTDTNVYTFLYFTPGIHDGPIEAFTLNMRFGSTKYSKGIFGSQIFAKDSVIQLVKNEWIIPTTKREDMGAERTLSAIFDRHGIEIIGLGHFDPGKVERDEYPFFTKKFGGRY